MSASDSPAPSLHELRQRLARERALLTAAQRPLDSPPIASTSHQPASAPPVPAQDAPAPSSRPAAHASSSTNAIRQALQSVVSSTAQLAPLFTLMESVLEGTSALEGRITDLEKEVAAQKARADRLQALVDELRQAEARRQQQQQQHARLHKGQQTPLDQHHIAVEPAPVPPLLSASQLQSIDSLDANFATILDAVRSLEKELVARLPRGSKKSPMVDPKAAIEGGALTTEGTPAASHGAGAPVPAAATPAAPGASSNVPAKRPAPPHPPAEPLQPAPSRQPSPEDRKPVLRPSPPPQPAATTAPTTSAPPSLPSTTPPLPGSALGPGGRAEPLPRAPSHPNPPPAQPLRSGNPPTWQPLPPSSTSTPTLSQHLPPPAKKPRTTAPSPPTEPRHAQGETAASTAPSTTPSPIRSDASMSFSRGVLPDQKNVNGGAKGAGKKKTPVPCFSSTTSNCSTTGKRSTTGNRSTTRTHWSSEAQLTSCSSKARAIAPQAPFGAPTRSPSSSRHWTVLHLPKSRRPWPVSPHLLRLPPLHLHLDPLPLPLPSRLESRLLVPIALLLLSAALAPPPPSALSRLRETFTLEFPALLTHLVLPCHQPGRSPTPSSSAPAAPLFPQQHGNRPRAHQRGNHKQG
ncbi:hypothetical protein JCM1840_005430 [Sporobolomyces johnsonii]